MHNVQFVVIVQL